MPRIGGGALCSSKSRQAKCMAPTQHPSTEILISHSPILSYSSLTTSKSQEASRLSRTRKPGGTLALTAWHYLDGCLYCTTFGRRSAGRWVVRVPTLQGWSQKETAVEALKPGGLPASRSGFRCGKSCTMMLTRWKLHGCCLAGWSH